METNQMPIMHITMPQIIGGEVICINKGLKIDGLDPIVVEPYKGPRIYRDQPTDIVLDILFKLDLKDNVDNNIHEQLSKWSKLMIDPLTGAIILKNEYVAKLDIIHSLKSWSFKYAYLLTNLDVLSLNDGIIEIKMRLFVDTWDDLFFLKREKNEITRRQNKDRN